MSWSQWPPVPEGAKAVAHDGWTEHKTWAEFAAWVAAEHRDGVYAKGRGPHWSPTINETGHRHRLSTVAVTALHLDSDSGHDWDILLGRLDEAGAAYLAYRSASHSEQKPKWHIVLPLSEPFRCGDVTDPNKDQTRISRNRAWNGIYAYARVLVGELAGFSDAINGGFDAAPSSTASACFLGHRRTPDADVREVRWADGLGLDGRALASAARSAAQVSPTSSSSSSSSSSSPSSSSSSTTRFGSSVRKTLDPNTPITLTGSGPHRTLKLSDITARATAPPMGPVTTSLTRLPEPASLLSASGWPRRHRL